MVVNVFKGASKIIFIAVSKAVQNPYSSLKELNRTRFKRHSLKESNKTRFKRHSLKESNKTRFKRHRTHVVLVLFSFTRRCGCRSVVPRARGTMLRLHTPACQPRCFFSTWVLVFCVLKH